MFVSVIVKVFVLITAFVLFIVPPLPVVILNLKLNLSD